MGFEGQSRVAFVFLVPQHQLDVDQHYRWARLGAVVWWGHWGHWGCGDRPMIVWLVHIFSRSPGRTPTPLSGLRIEVHLYLQSTHKLPPNTPLKMSSSTQRREQGVRKLRPLPRSTLLAPLSRSRWRTRPRSRKCGHRGGLDQLTRSSTLENSYAAVITSLLSFCSSLHSPYIYHTHQEARWSGGRAL